MTARGYSDSILRVRLKDGRARYRLRMWVAGELKKATFPSKESAEAARDFLLARRRAESLGIPGPTLPTADPTIADVFEAFEKRLVNLGRSEVYRLQVVGVRKLFERWRGAAAPAAFTRRDLEEFVGWCRMPGNTKSRGRQIRNAIGILRMVLRDSEARALTIGDVGLKAGLMHVHHGKGKPGERGSEEVHPIPPGALAALKAYRAREPRDLPPGAPFLAIEAKRGRGALRRQPLQKDSLRKRLRAASVAAGIPVRQGLGWLRHQAATLASASGQGIVGVSGALGHVDGQMVAATYDESSRAREERWRARAELGARIDALLPVALPEGKA